MSAVFGFSGIIAAGIVADVIAAGVGVAICIWQKRIIKKAQLEVLIDTAELAVSM